MIQAPFRSKPTSQASASVISAPERPSQVFSPLTKEAAPFGEVVSCGLTPEQLQGWLTRVQLMVKPRRFEHVMRVAELARAIAVANQINPKLAYWAGVLHDVARDLPDSELLRLAPPECEIDQHHPLALHGRAGRVLIEHWGIEYWGTHNRVAGKQQISTEERTILEAVEDHTTGPRASNRVSACVYIADVSEPGRGVNADIRELAMHDLPAALRQAIVSKVTYLQGRGIKVHPRTLSTYHSLR
jgi:predicted HD superfamily hydrolase involved in NAD metabolism